VSDGVRFDRWSHGVVAERHVGKDRVAAWASVADAAAPWRSDVRRTSREIRGFSLQRAEQEA